MDNEKLADMISEIQDQNSEFAKRLEDLEDEVGVLRTQVATLEQIEE